MRHLKDLPESNRPDSTYGLFIDNEWSPGDSGERVESFNPATVGSWCFSDFTLVDECRVSKSTSALECTGGKLDLFGEMKARCFGLQHPQRDLYRIPIGMLNRHRVRGMSRPGEGPKRTINQWVERIVNRHRGRHGS